MDIKERMYIGYGTSFKSEKDAFQKALDMAKELGIKIKSLRLDKYYSAEAYAGLCQEYLVKVNLFIIPKSNIAHLGIGEWCLTVYRFMEDTKVFLKYTFH